MAIFYKSESLLGTGVHMLGENCPVVSPTPEDYDMSNIEQSEAPRDKLAPEKPDSSLETQSSTESQQELSTVEERTDGKNSSTEGTGTDSDSGSASESSDEDGSELVSSVPETPLREPVSSTSQKNLVVTQKAQVNPESTSETNPPSVGNQKLTSKDSTESISDTRSSTETNMKSLRDFKLPHFDGRLNNTGFIDRIMRKSKLSISKNTELARDILGMALDLLDNRTNTEYWDILY